MALKADGTVVVWGDNSQGQRNVPASLSNAVAIAGGGAHSLAIAEGGTVLAWGDNLYGQSVVGTINGRVSAIAAGSYHSLALLGQLPASPRLLQPTWHNRVLTVSLATLPGKAYFLQFRNSINDQNWTIASAVVGNGAITKI